MKVLKQLALAELLHAQRRQYPSSIIIDNPHQIADKLGISSVYLDEKIERNIKEHTYLLFYTIGAFGFGARYGVQGHQYIAYR